jgi:hypothetical protein
MRGRDEMEQERRERERDRETENGEEGLNKGEEG